MRMSAFGAKADVRDRRRNVRFLQAVNSRLGAPRAINSVTAHTSASSRSGEPPDKPPKPKSHISSSSAGIGGSTCFTLPCA